MAVQQQSPVLTPPTMEEFKAAQAADVARQKGETETITAKQMFDTIMSSTTVEDIQNTGYKNIGDVILTPRTLEGIRSNPQKMTELFLEFKKGYNVQTQEPGKLAVPFSGPAYEQVYLPPKFQGIPEYENIVRNNQAVARVLSNYNIPVEGQEIILEGFVYGDLGNEILRSFRELPADVTQGLPTLGTMGVAALFGVGKGTYNRIWDMDDPTTTFGAGFSSGYQDAMSASIPYLKSVVYDPANYSVVAASGEKRWADWYKSKFIEKYGEQGWLDAHTQPKYDVVVGEDGLPVLTEDGKGVKITEVRDENGKIVRESTLDERIFSDLLDASFNDLSGAEKALTFFSTNAPMVQLSVWRSSTKGSRILDRVNSARKNNPDKFSSDMTDYEVWIQVRNSDTNALRRTWDKTWDVLTKPFGGRKGQLSRAQVMSGHLATLKSFKDRINDLEDRIEKKDFTSPGELRDMKSDLDLLKSRQKRYITASGGGKIANPFQRAAFMDDVYISVAMGYAPSYIPFVSEDTAQVMSGIASPFVAPAATRGGISLTRKLVQIAPITSKASQSVKELAIALENSDMLPFLSPGMIVRGDVTEIQEAARAYGMNLSESNIQSIKVFQKIINAAEDTPDARFGKNPDGSFRSPRQMIIDSLRNYGDTMSGIRKSMATMKDANGNAAFTAQEIQDNMQLLHLSAAHASGLAPLVAVQHLNSRALNPSSLTNKSKLNEVLNALAQEDQLYRGMDANLNIFLRSFQSKGIDIDKNASVQSTIQALRGVVDRGRESLSKKQQALDEAVNIYLKNPENLTPDTFDLLIDMKLVADMGRGREYINIVDLNNRRMQIIDELEDLVLNNFRNQADALYKTAGDAKEIDQQVASLSRGLFDSVLKLRRARGSARYAEVDAYVVENNLDSVDLNNLVSTLLSKDEELAGTPIATNFVGGKQFLRQSEPLKDALEAAAKRNLDNRYGEDAASMLVSSMLEDGDIKSMSYTEAAFLLAQRDQSANPFDFFTATVEEAEHLQRFFRDRARALDTKGLKTDKELMLEYEAIIDEEFMRIDPSGELIKLLDTARLGYKEDVFDKLETGTYGGTVTKGTKRLSQVEEMPGMGLRVFSSKNVTPERPFLKIGDMVAEIATTTDGDKIQALQSSIAQERDSVMIFLGASRNSAGVPAFDMRDPTQRKAADNMQRILQLVIDNRVGRSVATEVEQLIPKPLLEGLSPTERQRITREKIAEREGAFFDFGRAARLQEAEASFSFPVINQDGSDGIRTILDDSSISQKLPDIDTMIKEVATYQNTYKGIQREVNDADSKMRIETKRELDAANEAVLEMVRAKGLAEKPEQFFDSFFELATPESTRDTRDQLKFAGMTDDEIDLALKTMYVRGLMNKADHRYIKTTGMTDAVQEVQDITVLIDYLNDPDKRAVMVEVMGEEHVEIMDNFTDWATLASGNGAGFRASPDTRGMSVDSAIARFFNLARGMVSPQYVATEVGLRLMLENNQGVIKLAMQDREAATILNKIVSMPDDVTQKDIERLGFRIRTYLAVNTIQSGTEVLPLEVFLGEDAPTPTDLEMEMLEQERQRLRELQGAEE